MADGDNMCCQCEIRVSEYCKDCANIDITQNVGDDKVDASDSSRQSPDPPSLNCIGDRFDGRSLQAVSVRLAAARSDEDEAEDSAKNFFSPYSLDTSDVDSSSVSTRHEFNSFMSVGSSPSDSPSRIQIASNRIRSCVHSDDQGTPRSSNDGSFDQEQHMAVLKSHEHGMYDDFSIFNERCEKSRKPLDFETNDRIWFPPPPDDENSETDNNFFSYAADDDDEVGDSNGEFSVSESLMTDKPNEEHQEPLKSVVQGHFQALVSQLLQSEFNSTEKWLDVITSLAWQAANFVKPDTSRGGSMDPGDYVKIKCIASGSPTESIFVKGVVCTKNIKHKRMTSQYKNARLLMIGGALEYDRSQDQLSSIETLLQQEMDHLKMIVSRIEAHRPNVLLVEKSVASYAQEYLLAKDISLVSNIKRSLLDRVSRCTGAPITPSIAHISTARLGQCELFRLEKVSEEHEIANQSNRKPLKTLMFFEGCPRRLGCTVLLKGASREELKRVKHVVQYAIFAAYHLSLETSFLADEGASLPKMTKMPFVVESEATKDDSSLSILEVTEDQSFSPVEDRDVEIVSSLLDNDLEASEDQEEIKIEKTEVIDASDEYYSAADNHQSILVSFSSHCVLNGTVCERSRLLRIKFYGLFDKPLGRYLQDDLFNQTSLCPFCKEPAEAHVTCYTHQQGNLTINVRRLRSLKLSGEKDGKIWMWHRCLRCTPVDGVPPANHRVIMSDAAWGLSLGKFLELSFSNHATANRVASCGHSLQRDCLRFYGMGNMVAFFRYSPIDILSVHLPPPVLQFGYHFQQDWLKKEVAELLNKLEALYEELLHVLNGIEAKNELPDSDELSNHIGELKDQLIKERYDYIDLLQSCGEENGTEIDVFELNRLRHSLMIDMHFWDRRISSLNLYGRTSKLKPNHDSSTCRSDSIPEDTVYSLEPESNQTEQNEGSDNVSDSLSTSYDLCKKDEIQTDTDHVSSLERAPSAASVLSDKIDSAWAGTRSSNPTANHLLSRLSPSPVRVYSFDSAIRQQERIKKGSPLHLSTLRSFHASGDYVHMVRDPVHNLQRRCYSQAFPGEDNNNNNNNTNNLDFLLTTRPTFLPEGARLMIPNGGQRDIVMAVYDNEPTSIISYALTSKEHQDWVTDKISLSRNSSVASSMTTWQSFTTIDQDYTHYGSYGSEDPSSAIGPLFMDRKSSNHVTIPFEDESGADGKVKFSVTCYYAKQFDLLREKCCPNEMDYVRSLSRCKRWSAQGGKSNVYFAKSLDERFIIKQVTKTELESFEEFAPEYFKYLMDSLNSGSPTCLAKILGIYQVTVKHLRAGKEAKMNVLVMENVFFKRNISRVYDLKGSSRSRYNSDTTGTNKTLLDMNLLEALRTNPIFLGSKAKRTLERAVWNDTSFLASIDVIDYSLLVGVDEERKELVLGIIDFMRQYTWDKHLETWVKASGILGGPKNATPTIISPKQYKKRFRKAMTSYFLTVPEQWSS
ncbi:putative 1-phosphatidylinositol-3-phosphate 5-kinase [Helianthus annuus]|uniref:1-phosphatidylinositol-3-phosphate 5-kinase n=1 Tax=Helianthus annuus TaxID=4232 RepID=A0A251TSY9_HELAN|nr:putative 1-phosphatidylinositol-3-phosphate 5-kinase FAB1C [Helianthus annuus]KAF5777306.1 putative 1-phosphatidylinositol-3-phosphate 5-kinase [Helianthus annuus]KAJ0488866.1 putative 1-phosphatidylinositol-3-phosphate 5-kinase [Helianthus annuus]KAJ0504706.1 putative 1-phosphatidylinositol-3-phosphate 5-kinase [Helianthus annuus]KAJ0674438.1 putative 1-phosphatidylinositol-3-phosphate 5-kinase [Helianthus annuus]